MVDVSVPDDAAAAEWPPREWREGRRGGSARDVYKVVFAIVGIMIVLVVLSFWGMSNG